MIPLMMQQGYEADGWLGLLLGTSVWYALYGETLASDSAFDGRLSALSREIGTRGRADAVVRSSARQSTSPQPAEHEPQPVPDDPPPAGSRLKAELEAMRLGALSFRAARAGVDAAAIDAAEDTADPKAAIIELILVEETLLAMA